MNSADLFQASDLFESGNMAWVQVSLLALAGRARTKGLQNGMDTGIKYSEKQEHNFNGTMHDEGGPVHHWAPDGHQ